MKLYLTIKIVPKNFNKTEEILKLCRYITYKSYNSNLNIYIINDLDTRAITTRLEKLIKNQITFNEMLSILVNWILKFKKKVQNKNMGYKLKYILMNVQSLQQQVVLVDLIKSKITVIGILGK